MEIAVFVVIVIFCILCYKLSDSFNQQTEKIYGQGCVNGGWSLLTAVLIAVALFTIGEKQFWLFAVLSLCSVGVSAWCAYEKMISLEAPPEDALKGALAQAASSVGIAAAIIFMLFLFFDHNQKRRRR